VDDNGLQSLITEITGMRRVTVCQCVILLERPVASALPVSLMSCAGRPFLAWLLRELQRFGVEEFVFLTEVHLPEIVVAIEGLQVFLPKPADMLISYTPCGYGTGGALLHARQHLRERFLFCHANVLFSCNLSHFLRFAGQGHWLLLNTGRQADVHVTEADKVSLNFENGKDREIAPGMTGVCLFEASIFETLTKNCSLQDGVLPGLAQHGDLNGVRLAGTCYQVSDVHDLAKVGRQLPGILHRPAVFLDRDGVINRDFGWVGTRERFEWEPGALDAIGRITEAGYHVFIVTNQSGIARGFYSEEDLQQLMVWVIDTIRQHGGTVDEWRYCPMHPEAQIEQYRGASEDRKPAPGMIVDLLNRWEVDPDCCILFGDQPSDMQAARAAGIEGMPVGVRSLSDLIVGEDILEIGASQNKCSCSFRTHS